MHKLSALGFACAAALAFTPFAFADGYTFSFSGNGITASGQFSATPVAGTDYEQINSVSGVFTDTNDGVSGTITGLVGTAAPNDGNDSHFFTPGGALSYDQLFWPGGDSPNNCADYPFFGGEFDVYGLAFYLSDGDIGAVWSDGVIPGVGQVYGAGDASTLSSTPLDDPDMGTGQVVSLSIAPTPEPGSLALLGTGLTGIAAELTRRRKRAL